MTVGLSYRIFMNSEKTHYCQCVDSFKWVVPERGFKKHHVNVCIWLFFVCMLVWMCTGRCVCASTRIYTCVWVCVCVCTCVPAYVVQLLISLKLFFSFSDLVFIIGQIVKVKLCIFVQYIRTVHWYSIFVQYIHTVYSYSIFVQYIHTVY